MGGKAREPGEINSCKHDHYLHTSIKAGHKGLQLYLISKKMGLFSKILVLYLVIVFYFVSINT